jgi:two-component system, chemotaxis family, response regulator Rcp1
MDNAQPVEILLVEDNPGDVRLTREALRDARILNHISVAEDGVAALAFLRRALAGRDAAAPQPDLILLDLNLPRKSGLQVLAEIKGDPDLRRIPVAVLTSSRAERDILASYDLHANCYITKPVDLDRFISAVQAIEEFWFTIVKLPLNGKGQ